MLNGKGIRWDPEGDTEGHPLRRRPLRLTGCSSDDNFQEVLMLKRRFRLPSPALVISMIALTLVLGGTAVAATATHGDKKADTKLIKKLAPSLSVKHAKTAANATNAVNATHATSATSATNATNAPNATNATNAANATNATNATHATSASAASSPGVLGSGQTETGVVHAIAPQGGGT